jgi:hypothetical protein
MSTNLSPTAPFDRTSEDVGNIVALEHVNTKIPDQQTATVFYVSGLGLTRDPFLMTGIDNIWINVGRSQFHLPTGDPQVLRGTTGLVVPDLEALVQRLGRVRHALSGTRFAFHESDGYVDTVSPWGNRIRCHAPEPRFGSIALGLAYVEFDVPAGAIDGIGRFYRRMLGASVGIGDDAGGPSVRVTVGVHQALVFRASTLPQQDYDGHHIQIYLSDFSAPYFALAERGLITGEVNQHQYLFDDVVDPDSGKRLYKLQHEVRSLRHPLYNRPLVNRNPAQTNTNYVPGNDAWVGARSPGR